MNDIREKPRLRKRHLSYNEARNAVICDLKRRHSDCQVVPEWKEKQIDPIPLVIDGQEIHTDLEGKGYDPSSPNHPYYT